MMTFKSPRDFIFFGTSINTKPIPLITSNKKILICSIFNIFQNQLVLHYLFNKM